VKTPKAPIAFLQENFLEKNEPDDPGLAAASELLEAWTLGHTALRLSPEKIAALKKHRLTGNGEGEPRPMVLHGELLQTWRLFHSEKAIAERLRALAASPCPGALSAETRGLLARLFPDSKDPQALAARSGLERRFTLITGGPGTGKTYTAALLMALLFLENPDLRIAIAAPTGKAAQRLGESIRKAAAGLPDEAKAAVPLLQKVAATPATLHRLLGWNPGLGALGRHEERPLACDVLLVDEVSMIDGSLWLAMLHALPSRARLIALGDPGQLESVAPGRVLGALIEASTGGSPLSPCLVELTKNHRFKDDSAIAAASAAVRRNDGAGLMKLCGEARGDLCYGSSARLDALLDELWPAVMKLASAREPREALQALTGFRILCAVNKGPWGVEGLGRRVEKRLRKKFSGPFARPILVTVNDPATHLFNGDLGVLLPSRDGAAPKAVFGTAETLREIAEAGLPEHEDAWAMTVHRAQGSEYDEIFLVLPKVDSLGEAGGEDEPVENVTRLLIPELLYTAITRAKTKVTLVADEDVLLKACEARPARVTGLAGWISAAQVKYISSSRAV
jgi:exodeoxyribonuclease V alpha subunit